ncbi:hypothetical protein NIES4102_05710 [Chondrocystis sp. NIES-4102]|nr:hypothetical protein NIES4102_05710 [Chondrocystis sp. NIES-4102]
MKVNRRHFLLFFGAITGSVATGTWGKSQQPLGMAKAMAESKPLSFEPVQTPIPLNIDDLATAQQIKKYANYTVVDDLVLPSGFTYDVLAVWGDRVGDSRFGYSAIRSP